MKIKKLSIFVGLLCLIILLNNSCIYDSKVERQLDAKFVLPGDITKKSDSVIAFEIVAPSDLMVNLEIILPENVVVKEGGTTGQYSILEGEKIRHELIVTFMNDGAYILQTDLISSFIDLGINNTRTYKKLVNIPYSGDKFDKGDGKLDVIKK